MWVSCMQSVLLFLIRQNTKMCKEHQKSNFSSLVSLANLLPIFAEQVKDSVDLLGNKTCLHCTLKVYWSRPY